jgi:hypothetical protein
MVQTVGCCAIEQLPIKVFIANLAMGGVFLYKIDIGHLYSLCSAKYALMLF